MKIFRITATAPTGYQYRSVSYFGKPKANGNGSYTFQQDFDTEEEAKDYLKERASYYFTDSQEELEVALEQIDKYGSVRMDAVAGGIEEIEAE